MDKWIKDALKKTEEALIAETEPRSNDRSRIRWIFSVVRHDLLKAYAEAAKSEVDKAKGEL